MLRLTVSILLTLWACVSLNAAEPQSLGILRVSVDSTAADIGPDLANANSASIIISTDIRDLKLQISSQSIGDPLIEALEYDSVTHEYFYSVKPLTGGQKYILTLLFFPVIATAKDKTEDISSDWLFILKDEVNAKYAEYDDSGWRMLSLPHDWAFENGFSPEGMQKDKGGYTSGGIGWYRKYLLVMMFFLLFASG